MATIKIPEEVLAAYYDDFIGKTITVYLHDYLNAVDFQRRSFSLTKQHVDLSAVEIDVVVTDWAIETEYNYVAIGIRFDYEGKSQLITI